MNLPTTEDRDPISIGLSKKSDEDVLSLLLQRQKDALNATETAIPEIAKAAKHFRLSLFQVEKSAMPEPAVPD